MVARLFGVGIFWLRLVATGRSCKLELLSVMRLGLKSRLFLEVFVASCFDALGTLSAPSARLAHGCGWDSAEAQRRQLLRLEKSGLLELTRSGNRWEWVVRLTGSGSRMVTDDIEPENRWAKDWDGKWHLLSFDLPSSAVNARYELKEWLNRRRFGRLQGSVRVSAIFEESWKSELSDLKIAPTNLVFFEGSPYGVNTDFEVLNVAWDFKTINTAYGRFIDFHRRGLPSREDSEGLNTWMTSEISHWKSAFDMDPFLPESLLPTNYLGKKALDMRRTSYQKLFH